MHPQHHHARDAAGKAPEAMARTRLLGMAAGKWRIIRVFENLAHLVKPLIPTQAASNPVDPPGKILVVEFWNLGDLAILVPFLTNLRRTFPNAKITLLINAGLESVLDGQGIVDEFIPVRVPWARHFRRWRKYNPFSRDWILLVRTLYKVRKRRFDWAFSGRMDVRDNFLLWLTGARRRIGYDFAGGAAFLTDRILPDLTHPHRSDIWLHLLEAMDIRVDRKLGYLELTRSEEALARSHFVNFGIPPDALLIGIHPGARIATRRWGEDRFAEVARRLLTETEAHILWFSEPGTPGPEHCLERCHFVSLSFRGFLALLSRCKLLICNDSGPMHLANLLNVPVVAVFGPQRPEWFGPRGSQDRVVIRPEFSCRPCWDYCAFKQPYCLRTISVDEAYEAVKSQMNHLLESGRTTPSSPDWLEVLSNV